MGTWRNTQADFEGQLKDSKRLEKQCPFPNMMCECCMSALIEEIGYNNYKIFCLIRNAYVVEPINRKLGTESAYTA